jgi:hypothetical protein
LPRYLQAEGSGTWQVPPMHFAPALHLGPFVSSQAPPSSAMAPHVPMGWPGGVHIEPVQATRPLFKTPHCSPGIAKLIFWQTLVMG